MEGIVGLHRIPLRVTAEKGLFFEEDLLST